MKQKEVDDARCSECKQKTAPDPDNPIIICDGCVGGALHFLCAKKFPLEAIPGEEDEVRSPCPIIHTCTQECECSVASPTWSTRLMN